MIQEATIKELAYLIKETKDKDLPKPIFFLGAGASKTGDVPLASEISDDILEQYCKNPKIASLKVEEKKYSKLMQCLSPYERNQLLKGYIDKAKINVTHIYLAQLIANDLVDYVLTVNFDNLMLRALALYNIFPATYDLAILKDMTTTTFKEKSVVYLHGQHHGLWLLNTDEEMGKVKEIIPPILNKIANQRLWVFIGYSGEDPIFDHIIKLGRFDNGLYWIAYNDNIPGEKVCNKLLEAPNTNTFLLKGFDSDTFLTKLNSELELKQPEVIDKPFTSLRKSLDNIVDIDDKEHFKGVRERLEIVRKQVDEAIKQFEEGNITDTGELKEQTEIDILKKQIIDRLVNQDYNDLELLEKSVLKINNIDLNNLLSQLYGDSGIAIHQSANANQDQSQYNKCIEMYLKATELNPNDDTIFYNWGLALSNLAKLRNDESLYKESFEKFKLATKLNSKDDSAFYNWGSALSELANIQHDESLFKESIEKFKLATELNPKKDSAFNNWGLALSEIAKLRNDESLFQESVEKFKKAAELNPRIYSAFNNWGLSLKNLAKLKKNESLFEESFEKFKKAAELNPKKDSAFINWGLALTEIAKLKNDEALFEESFEKFKKAAELNPKSDSAFDGWGLALSDLAKLKNDESLFQESIRILNKGVALGGSTYNLACVYALTKNKEQALHFLEITLKKNEIDIEFVKNDNDWKHYFEDEDFKALIKKYS